MSERVAITGLGVVSALGNNTSENFEALKNGISGISKPTILQTRHNQLPVGEIKVENRQLAEELQLKKDEIFTRAALLGAKAAQSALQDAAISNIPKNLAFVNATSVGGMDYTESAYRSVSGAPKNYREAEAQHPGFTTDSMAYFLKIKGLVSTVSTACSSGANALLFGSKLLKSKRADYVLAGGTDCLSQFTLNGFRSLKILSGSVCKPFDENRTGLNLGEGAAYLVLERESDARKAGKKIYAFLAGAGNANDAHHQTASSETGEGSFLAMQAALNSAGLAANEIDYINAHGTATENNDLSEGIAIERVFGQNPPALSSTKAFTGHTLAAAGAIEAVFSVMALQEQCVFPNLNFQDAMASLHFTPETTFKPQKLRNVLSNSFGFGGNCSSLIFSSAS